MFEQQPEDIFAGVEPTQPEPLRPRGAISPTVPGRPGAPTSIGAMPPTREELGEAPAPRKRFFLVIMAVVLLAILGLGGYLAWKQFMAKPVVKITPTPEVLNVNEPETAPVEAPPTNVALPTSVCGNGVCETGEDSAICPTDCPAPPSPVVGLDTDLDGLSDEEEITLGTDQNKIDSDEDGLTDREEVKIYNTNPLNSDTDGDTYKDGDEVRNGYNPNGPGRLLEVPE